MKRKQSETQQGSTGAVDQPSSVSLDEMLDQPRALGTRSRRRTGRTEAVVIGRLVGLTGSGEALVIFDDDTTIEPSRCRSVARLGDESIGREVALMFEDGDRDRPLIMGVLQEAKEVGLPDRRPVMGEVTRDGETIVLTADKEIQLRCGEASITLTKSGKVVIRGAYVSSRSSGMNRINGASVQIN